jgi:hypothetical protein
LWRTWLPSVPAAWTVYLETWPRQGMTRSGVAYEPATSAPRTAGKGCSCSPGPEPDLVLPTFCAARGGAATKIPRLLRTPVAARISSAGTDPAIRRAAGHEIDLVDVAAQLRVTPASLPQPDQASGTRHPAGELLPTPTALLTWRTPEEHMAWRRRNGRTRPCDLQAAVGLLPGRQEPDPA